MTIGHPMTIEFSTRKLALLLAVSALFVLGGLWLITGDFTDTRRGALAPLAGWASIIFFGLCGVVVLGKLSLGEKTALTLTKTGFTYPTYSSDEIPWSFVADIQTMHIHRNKLLSVNLAPEAIGKIRRRRINRVANWADAKMADPGVLLNANVLSLSHDQLYAALQERWFADKATRTPLKAPTP